MNTLFKHNKFVQKDFENTNKTVYLFQKKQNSMNTTIKDTVNKVIESVNNTITDKSKQIESMR